MISLFRKAFPYMAAFAVALIFAAAIAGAVQAQGDLPGTGGNTGPGDIGEGDDPVTPPADEDDDQDDDNDGNDGDTSGNDGGDTTSTNENQFGATSYDANGNGLIEVDSVAKLNAIRWDLNGDGIADRLEGSDAEELKHRYYKAFPDIAPCGRDGCRGYELMADLDIHASNLYPKKGWEPIGNFRGSFDAIFEGNGNTIYGLRISREGNENGLFGRVGSDAIIRNLHLRGFIIENRGLRTGAIAGFNKGKIIGSSATGALHSDGQRAVIGGLVGMNTGLISASYADIHFNVHRAIKVGGLAGENTGLIIASYAKGRIGGGLVLIGRLVGQNYGGRIQSSYAYIKLAPRPGHDKHSVGGVVGYFQEPHNQDWRFRSDYVTNIPTDPQDAVSDTYAVFRNYTPTVDEQGKEITEYETGGEKISYGAFAKPKDYKGIFKNWNVNVFDGDDRRDDPWDFGGSRDLPALKFKTMDVGEQQDHFDD